MSNILYGKRVRNGVEMYLDENHRRPILDGKNGKPVVFPKSELFGATYGRPGTSLEHCVRAMTFPERLKVVTTSKSSPFRSPSSSLRSLIRRRP